MMVIVYNVNVVFRFPLTNNNWKTNIVISYMHLWYDSLYVYGLAVVFFLYKYVSLCV